MSMRSRLAKLSHAQLLGFAVDACERSTKLKHKADALIAQLVPLPSWCVDILLSPLLEFAMDTCESSRELMNKADALIAQVAPLPTWCVDILMSPDLLPQFFSSLGPSDHAAAGVCAAWSHAYSRQLRRMCYVDPRRVQLLQDVPMQPNGLCMLPGGVLAIASSCEHYGEPSGDGSVGPGSDAGGVRFLDPAARHGYPSGRRHDDLPPGAVLRADPHALAACRAGSLAAMRFGWLVGLARTNDGLLVNRYQRPRTNDPPGALYRYKFAKDGSMGLLATAPALAGYERGFKQVAVHQQTQRAYGIVGVGRHNAVLLLGAQLPTAPNPNPNPNPSPNPNLTLTLTLSRSRSRSRSLTLILTLTLALALTLTRRGRCCARRPWACAARAASGATARAPCP